MSLKKNIVASYVSQIYVALVGILILPVYIKHMGAEVYGLIGFFTMLQAFFALLDLGLTPTIGRETARYRGAAISALEYIQLYRALSIIFFVIAIAGGVGLFMLSGLIATRWLIVESLPLAEVRLFVQIMAISVAMRWMCGLYRGVVTGSEQLVWLSGFSVMVATLRFIIVLPVMWLYGFTPFVFFVYQLLIAFFEVIGLTVKSRQLLPASNNLRGAIGWSFEPVKSVLRFSLAIAFTSSVWVLVTQTDKLVLSGILPLKEYGYFTLAILVASGIMIISSPISSAIMPLMTRLHAEGKSEDLIRVYRTATQLICIIAGSVSITLACCAEQLLFAWTGDSRLAMEVAPILRLYALGNGILAVAAFPYYLQYAKGNLRYHLIGNAGMVTILIPSIIYIANYFGGVGAGYVWLTTNFLFFLLWVAYTHHKLEPGLHIRWFVDDVLKIILPVVIFSSFLLIFDVRLIDRLDSLIYVSIFGFLLISVAMLFSDAARFKLRRYFFNK